MTGRVLLINRFGGTLTSDMWPDCGCRVVFSAAVRLLPCFVSRGKVIRVILCKFRHITAIITRLYLVELISVSTVISIVRCCLPCSCCFIGFEVIN